MPFEMPDPRGPRTALRSPAAPRLAGTRGADLLLVDNGKLSPAYGANEALVTLLPELFPDARWSHFSRNLLACDQTQIAGLCDEISGFGASGVVIALADAGVSVQSVLVAAELERRGVPVVVLATAAGTGICRGIARSRLEGLPVVTVDVARTDTTGTVRARLDAAREAILAGLTRPPAPWSGEASDGPLIFAPPSGDLSDMAAFQAWLGDVGLGDGMPLLPPLPATVAALLATVTADPDAVIYADAATSGRSLRIRDAAVNAAMTGCPPEAFPVVLAALRAVAEPGFRLVQAAITTHPSGYFVLMSGADPARYGLSGGPGCLGPGHRGNLAVGRTVSLAIQHLFDARPGGADLTVFGSPAEIAYCMAEATGLTPWPSLAADRGFDGPAVLVVKAEGPRNVLEHLATTPRDVCAAIVAAATSRSANNAYVPGDLVVLLGPEHAAIFAEAGWSRADLAQAIHTGATLPRAALEGRGVVPIRPAWMAAIDALPVTRSPSDVHIAVGGAAGPHSMVALPWGFSRGQWMPVTGA